MVESVGGKREHLFEGTLFHGKIGEHRNSKGGGAIFLIPISSLREGTGKYGPYCFVLRDPVFEGAS